MIINTGGVVEDNSFKQNVWIKACKAWEVAIGFAGFEDRKTAYLQGFYAGFNQASKEKETTRPVNVPPILDEE